MSVLCSMVITPNGYIARDDGTEDYSSHTNWLDYLETAKKYNNFVIGRKTLDAVKSYYNGFGFEDVDCQHKVLVSRQKEIELDPMWSLVSSPQEVIDLLNDKVEKILLVGGSEINSAFAKLNLIDEIMLTIEPYIIGKGINIFNPDLFDLKLIYKSVEKLSEGRIRVHYLVDKS